MHTTARLLDQAKTHSGIQSDYRLGVILGLSSSAIPNYRNGRSHPDERIAAALAELAGEDPDYVVACIQAERSKAPETRVLWERIAARLQAHGVAAAAVLAAVILSVWTSGALDLGSLGLAWLPALVLPVNSASDMLHIVAYCLCALTWWIAVRRGPLRRSLRTMALRWRDLAHLPRVAV